MESYGVLPADKLKIWTIFRNVGVEGEEILKRAKLVHVHDKEGFVVTKTDETYHFIHGGLGDAKIDRIPELCRVRVKEFIIGAINLAITEDGRLYSWCSELRSADTPIEEQTEQLGRSASGDGVYTPTQVQCGAAIHKIRQVALLGIGEGRVLALTVLGDVYHWATVRYKPTPIDKRQSNGRKVISVGCCAAAYFALSESGEIFRIGPQALEQLEVNVGGIPVKKIATTQTTICALTLDGKVHSWRLQGSWGQIEQMRIPLVAHFKDVQDIKTCWMEDVCIVEVKGNLRFACYLGIRMDVIVPYSSVPMEECIAQIGQKSYRTMIVGPIKEATKRTLGDSLWRNKKSMDVTFSLEGKMISAHKLVLTCGSEYFAKMFSGEWVEKKGSVIEIKDTKYETFEAILFHIYHDKVSFFVDENENICDLMKLADCYCEVKIRRECEEILMRNINDKNAFLLLQNAAAANVLELEKNATKFILDNRLLDVQLASSAGDLVNFLGREIFDKLALAAFRR